jgi:hypothetical protein
MRAEEGDETINDYADEARQAQSKVTRPNARRWLQNAFRLIGSWRGRVAGARVNIGGASTF